LIRASTVRPNIKYSVIDGAPTAEGREQQLEALVVAVLNDAEQPSGKVVVMCESKPAVKHIVESAGLFPCEAFHADIPSERQNEILDEFRAGNTRVIVATGAFGMGMDIPDIRLIVHMDEPRDMKEYGQASGRVGRDGLPSQAVILRGGLEFHDELSQRYMDTWQCRRIITDGYMDGDEERVCCQAGEEKCDVCEDSITGGHGFGEGSDEEHVRASDPGSSPLPVSTGTAIRQTPVAIPKGLQAPLGLQTPATSTPFVREVPDIQVEEWNPPSSPIRLDTNRPGPVGSSRGCETGPINIPSSPPPRRTEETPAYADRSRPGPQAASAGRTRQADSIQRLVAIQDQQRQIPRQRATSQSQRESQAIEEVRKRLAQWKMVCVVCKVKQKSHNHPITKCPDAQGQAAEKEREYISRRVRLAPGTACFKCAAPQQICEKWEGFRDTKKRCQFYGIIYGVVIGAKHACPEIWAQWVRRMKDRGHDITRQEDMIRVMGLRLGSEIEPFPMVWLLDGFMRLTKDMEHMEQMQRERANVGAEDMSGSQSSQVVKKPDDREE
jgi:hypothetical protein